MTLAAELTPSLMRPILLSLKELGAESAALAGANPHLAQLAREGFGDTKRNRGLADWPCGDLRGLIRAREHNRETPPLDLQRFFRDMAVLGHLQKGLDMQAELKTHFSGGIPFGFGLAAVAEGRAGVLRPFGIRPGRGEVTPADLRYCDRLVEIAQEAYRILADRLASAGMAWPCPCCGGLMTTMDAMYCSQSCASVDKRRRRYLYSKAHRERKQR